MNERIKELAEQNGFIHKHMSVGERNDALNKLDKFAELIIQECTNLFDAEHTEALDNHMEDWDRGYLGGLRVAKEIIQKHFGVDYFGDE
jgi:hypothetical protein